MEPSRLSEVVDDDNDAAPLIQRLWSYDHMALYKCVYYYIIIIMLANSRRYSAVTDDVSRLRRRDMTRLAD